jgi:uncharacterized protein (TIGR03437 family)
LVKSTLISAASPPLLCLGWLLAAASALAQTPCTFTFDPAGDLDVPRGGRRLARARIKASAPDCEYRLTGPSWINLDFNQSGVGDAEFAYTVTPNTGLLPRAASIFAGNSRFLVVQRGCSFSTRPAEVSASNTGGTGTFTVAADCPFEVESDVSWLRVAATENARTLAFTVDPNTTGNPRTGTLRVGPSGNVDIYYQAVPSAPVFRVRQGELLLPGSATVEAEGGQVAILVNFQPGVPWSATTKESWLSVTAGAAGVGRGTITIQVFPHSGPEPRVGEILIGGLRFVVTQQPTGCKYAASPDSQNFPAAGGSGSFQIGTACDWTASSTLSWITVQTVAGRGDGAVRFTVAPNPGSTARSGTIAVGGAAVTITQEANSCTYAVAPDRIEIDAAGGSGTFRVFTGAGCQWSAATVEDWIEMRSISVVAGEVAFVVYPNASAAARTGQIAISGQTFTIAQAGRGPQISSAGLVNAASFLSGAVAPGEIVTFFGQGIGPEELAGLELTPEGFVSNSLGGVRVLFDGVPAPLIYVLSTQVSAIVPYSVAGRSSTTIEIENQGVRSNPLRAPVAPAAPALFTADASGAGPGAFLNEDLSLNSADNPAPPGSIVTLYATGEGQTEPGGIDGKPAGPELPKPVFPVTVTIGGQEAEVFYTGAAPGFVAGLMQVNARIPDGVAAGPASVQLRVGDFVSRPGVTVAVGQ